MSFGFGFGFPKNYVAALFNTPASLFTTGVNGAWYDPSDFSTMFQDAAGTTPVTAVGQPVGLMLDKSKGLVLGPELVTNGDFSNGTTGWSASGATLSVVSGQLQVQTTGAGVGFAFQTFSTTAGKTYKITLDVNIVSGTGYIGVGAGGGSNSIYGSGAFTGTSSKTFVFTAAAATTTISLFQYTATAGLQARFDNISVRELPGNHAFNPSGNSANFPVLSARYNLLTKTEQFDDAAWTKVNATISGNAITVTGTVPTVFYYNAASSSQTNIDFKCSIKIKRSASTAKYVFFGLSDFTANSFACFLNLSDSSIINVTSGGASVTSATLSLVDSDGYQTLFITGRSTSWAIYPRIDIRPLNSANLNDGVVGQILTVKGADLRVANDALNQPVYQRVNTATDYDTVGFKPYLSFNGVNQWLQTNSIDFTYGDKMFVCAGVRKLSDASSGFAFEFSSSYSSNIGTFALSAPYAANQYAFVGKASASNGEAIVSSVAAPITNVASASYDFSKSSLASGEISPRINGAVPSISYTPAPSTDLGTGNFGNYPLYIGARAGTSLWFSGRLYGLVVAGKSASASEIASTETWLNQKTGAY